MADIADMVKWTAKDVAELRYEQLRDALDGVVTAL